MLQIIIDLKDRQKYPAVKMALGVQTSVISSAKVCNHCNYKGSNSCDRAELCVFIPLFFQTFTRSHVHPSVRSSVHPSVRPSVCLSVHLSVRPSIHPPYIHTFTHLPTHSFIHFFYVCLLVYFFFGHFDCNSRLCLFLSLSQASSFLV